MQYRYKPNGVCSTEMIFDIQEDKIEQVEVIGGCNGNLKGIASLIKGRDVEEVIEKLEGITCGYRKTSCPDQIAKALKSYKNQSFDR